MAKVLVLLIAASVVLTGCAQGEPNQKELADDQKMREQYNKDHGVNTDQ